MVDDSDWISSCVFRCGADFFGSKVSVFVFRMIYSS